MYRMGGKDRPSFSRRSGGTEREEVCPRGSPGRTEATSTKSRRSRTTGWAGRGEQDGKVYARNRLRYASRQLASSNPVDLGWFAVRTHPSRGWGTSDWV